MVENVDQSIVEATIEDLTAALHSGKLTAVDLVVKCLLRISTYDCRNTALNSVPLLNLHCLEEAALSDDRRSAGETCGLLEGIPFTAKDSYKVKGMAVASGSEAFQDLVANEDAFTVDVLRKAGAVLIGKTNMCPMAYGGMIRGVYGRAESPYNSKYLAAAFASGSSNGSGVSTAASFAAFGMGEETVSSGRSPASNNGLVAYTPSRGLISVRGNWPLYPTCDVVVPHTRTMDDLFSILDVVTAVDSQTIGDFWRDQPFVDIPTSWEDRPRSFSSLREIDFLKGKRIDVPEMYVGGFANASNVYTSDAVKSLWLGAKVQLEGCGAAVETCSNFPVVRVYENPSPEWSGENGDCTRLPEDWNLTERGTLIAHGWDDFLRYNGDINLPFLAAADPAKMFPQLPADDPQARFSEVANAVQWSKLATYVEHNTPDKRGMYDIPNLERAVKALEDMRKVLFEDWMVHNNFDFVAFPAAGDVGHADSDINVSLVEHTWKNGIKYSNGNRALRHLGIPSITVAMGLIPEKAMPIGLTILGRAYDDIAILKAGYADEQLSGRRVPPPLTPPLESDTIQGKIVDFASRRPELEVTQYNAAWMDESKICVSIEGRLSFHKPSAGSLVHPRLDIHIDGKEYSGSDLELHEASNIADGGNIFEFKSAWSISPPLTQDQRNAVVGKIARDSIMVIVLARDGERGRPSGCLQLIHIDDVAGP